MEFHARIELIYEQWTTLLDKAGAELLRFWPPLGDYGKGIVDAVL